MPRWCPESGKVVHPSKGKASAHLRGLEKRFEYAGHAYPCVYCRGWHVGRLKAKAHVNKYARA